MKARLSIANAHIGRRPFPVGRRRATALLLVSALFLLGPSGLVHGQEGLELPAGCRSMVRLDPTMLNGQIKQVERALEISKATVKNDDPDKARQRLAEQRVRIYQGRLIDLLFAKDCKRLANLALRQGQDRIREIAVKPQNVIITTYYATNRKRIETKGPIDSYGADRAAKIAFGRVETSIPTARQLGEMNLPTIWRLERSNDATKHFVVRAVHELGRDDARAEMLQKLGASDAKSVLIFVHGYNVEFLHANMRAAQLAHDLMFPGVTICFSWPSAGTTKGYWRDEEMVQLSDAAFEELLDEVVALNPSNIFVVAHSMGSRVVATAIQNRAIAGRRIRLNEVVLAAPDINADIFREKIMPAFAAASGVVPTIYASSGDMALQASKVVHDFARVGETIGGVRVISGTEMIDASAAGSLVRGYGHSYVMDSASVLADLGKLITQHKRAQDRDLKKQGAEPLVYWALQ